MIGWLVLLRFNVPPDIKQAISETLPPLFLANILLTKDGLSGIRAECRGIGASAVARRKPNGDVPGLESICLTAPTGYLSAHA